MVSSHTLNSKNKTQNHQSPAPRRSFSGFTLIELLIVIVVIGIVVSLAVVGLSRVRIASRDDKRVADISCIQKALEMYYNDNGSYPAAITPGQPMVGPTSGLTYIKAVPASSNKLDGSCATDTYTYTYVSASDYTLTYCLGGKTADIAAGNCTAKPGNMCAVATVADTGFASPGTVATDSSSGGSIDWTNPTYVLTENASSAGAGNTDAGCDYRVRIIKGGSIGTTDKSGVGAYPATLTYASYGGSSDLWGETWTVSDVNASTFGLAFAFDNACAHSAYSYYLKVTNFGFSVPVSATITGISADVKRGWFAVSFLADTKISTPTGSKNIEDIVEDDIVLAYDYAKRQVIPTKVLGLRRSKSNYLIIKTGSREIKVTPQHGIYVGQNKYKSAEDLAIGDWLIIGQNGKLIKEKIKSIEKVDDLASTYNFETDIYHNYLAEGVIVHNGFGAYGNYVDYIRLKVHYTN